MIPQATVTQKPVSPGRARYRPLKPLRRECRCFGLTCGGLTRMLFPFAYEAMGAAEHPAFPAPSRFRGRCFAQLGQIMPRECGRMLGVIAGAAKQSRATHAILDCFVAEPVIGRPFARPVGADSLA